jgi:endonuclease/exonuclease/phosphatase family metal-dependent hydrolase
MGQAKQLAVIGSLSVGLVVGLGLAGCGSSAPASTLTVMTRNMDEGTDFGPLVAATSASQFLSAAAAAWEEVEASNIPERAAGIAEEIATDKPDLVSIEEASIWRTGPLLKGPASTVVYDALGSLDSALSADGASYRLVVVENEFDLEGPTSLGYDVRVSDQDAILARSDLRLSDVQSGHFRHQLTLTPVGVKELIERGWTSVDVKVGTQTVRYVETHLESFSNPVQKEQAAELLAGPAHTSLPVILACDCNTGPGVTPTYQAMLSGGFTDTWTTTNPGSAGFTWPLHKEDPYAATATPKERIDLVLVKGAITPVSDRLVGNTAASLTPSGLWPSDHAGVLATLSIH